MQLKDLAATIAAVPCDAVLLGTPHDLTHLLSIPHSLVRVTYDIKDLAADVMRALSEGVSARGTGAVVLETATDLQETLQTFLEASPSQ